MRVLIAMDSFKGCMTSYEAGCAVYEGLKKVKPKVHADIIRIADGGEGLLEACGDYERLVDIDVRGAFGDTIRCVYGIKNENNRLTAVIETARIVGINLVSKNKLNPLTASSYGIGEVIIDAIRRGCRHFIIGLGGSLVNDGGAGMLQALGYKLTGMNGLDIPCGAQGLKDIVGINNKNVINDLEKCDFLIASDVTNSLCGTYGCSMVYAPQKGADESLAKKMDLWMHNYAEVVNKHTGRNLIDTAGVGAAGGLGFAFLSFTNSKICSGIDIVLENAHADEYMQNADIVITGEGHIDSQSAMGKTISGIVKMAKRYDKEVIAFAGIIDNEEEACDTIGLKACYCINSKKVKFEEAIKKENAIKNLIESVRCNF